MDIGHIILPSPIDTSSEHSDSDTITLQPNNLSISPTLFNHIYDQLEAPEPFLSGWDSVDPLTYPYHIPSRFLSHIEMSTQSNTQSYAIPNQSSITQLSKHTYHDWKLRLKRNLGAAGLAEFILYNQVKPDNPAERQKFKTNDLRALSVIQSTIDQSHFQIIAQCETA